MKTRLIPIIVILIAIISVSVLWWHGKSASSRVQVIHTVSYSNAAVFLAVRDYSEKLERYFVPDPGKHVEALLASATSRPVVSVTPFSNALIAMAKNPNLVIISGSGLNGLSLLSSLGSALDNLAGKRIGTARGDSLELFLYEAMSPRPYEPVYFTDPFLLVTAATNKQIDAATHVEPFATELTSAGLTRVLTSKSLWGDHPDAVVLTTRETIVRFRPALVNLLVILLGKENQIKKSPEGAANALAEFYKMSPSQLTRILGFQEPRIDIRNFVPFFEQRLGTLMALKYIDSKPKIAQLFDWSLLEEATKHSQ